MAEACKGTGRTDVQPISKFTGYCACPVCGKPVAKKNGGLRWHKEAK
jgi:hypothetical protein